MPFQTLYNNKLIFDGSTDKKYGQIRYGSNKSV